ncbi:MAG: PP2C family serine/threonine-protein phosphatase [Pyrinomonadaceae bacterium]
MTEENHELIAAAVSDRGLSEKRPLNEDSYLCDLSNRLFVVADGVGGAQAGEVASQTAIEVLGEAFRHHLPDVDNEDLMEMAIQRANHSIHGMAGDNSKMARMATTIVALHLDGNIATIGHVGDSRLYRLSPGGKLFRETRDHSVVEEEVRAGRMTPEQAVNHPSRNVISRALGAEETVDVEMRSVEVVPGTAFLLCSDGITRHIPDDELRNHMISPNSPEAICEELKRVCYERGAEDNLTAVMVRLQGATEYAAADGDEERTISTARMAPTTKLNAGATAALDTAPARATERSKADIRTTDEVPAALFVPKAEPVSPAPAPVTPAAPAKRGFFSRVFRFLLFLLLLAVLGVGAFLGGLYLQKKNPNNQISTTIMPSPPADAPAVLTGKPAVDAPEGANFDADRREVDRNAAAMVTKLAAQNPLAGTDPARAYLYGRALLLSGKPAEATAAFKRAAELLTARSGLESLKVDNAVSALAAAVKSNNEDARKLALNDLDQAMRMIGPPTGVAPSAGPTPK